MAHAEDYAEWLWETQGRRMTPVECEIAAAMFRGEFFHLMGVCDITFKELAASVWDAIQERWPEATEEEVAHGIAAAFDVGMRMQRSHN